MSDQPQQKMAGVARTAAAKLSALRALMREAKLAAYVIPTSDAHNSEYVSKRDERRTFISGFTGSAGTAVVTLNEAKLWTDGRYYLQASKELDASAGWGLMKDRLPETPTIEAWLSTQAGLSKGDAIGLDPFNLTFGAVKRMSAAFSKAGLTLQAVNPEGVNLVDRVWGSEQPPAPCSRLVAHPVQYSGVSVPDKLAQIREALRKEGCDALVVAALDEVAWAFNVRGSDVECNPVSIAYGIVTLTGATLCIDSAKLDADVSAHLAAAGVTIAPYEQVTSLVRSLPGKVWLDPASCNYALYQEALAGAAADGNSATASAASTDPSTRVLEKMSPIQLMKAVKNKTEMEGEV